MFTQIQLSLIKEAARKRKNQGEIAVYGYIVDHAFDQFSDATLDILKYIAEECKRQRSGETSVYDMSVAWQYVTEITGNLTVAIIEEIGRKVEPIDNAKGFRTGPVGIWDGYVWEEKAPWERVPFMLELLLESYYDGSLDVTNPLAQTREDQFYFEYENVHPFYDGNGRSGKCIYAYVTRSLNNPYLPPNFWGSSNP